MFGPVNDGHQLVTDEAAPGAAPFSFIGSVHNKITVKATMPTTDANGDPLTGLSSWVPVAARYVDGFHPFEGLATQEERLAVPGVVSAVVPLTPADAGLEKEAVLTVPWFGLTALSSAVNDA